MKQEQTNSDENFWWLLAVTKNDIDCRLQLILSMFGLMSEITLLYVFYNMKDPTAFEDLVKRYKQKTPPVPTSRCTLGL